MEDNQSDQDSTRNVGRVTPSLVPSLTSSLTAPLSSRPIPPVFYSQERSPNHPVSEMEDGTPRGDESPTLSHPGALRVLPLTPLQKTRKTVSLCGDDVSCNGEDSGARGKSAAPGLYKSLPSTAPPTVPTRTSYETLSEHGLPNHSEQRTSSRNCLADSSPNPCITLQTPTPTRDQSEPLQRKSSSKSEDKIPLTSTELTNSEELDSTVIYSDKPTSASKPDSQGDEAASKVKVSKKPSSRLSVEHQLLGVSSSTVSNISENMAGDGDLVTVNWAIHTAGLGKFHVVPFLAAVMVIAVKCFMDGVPDNFSNMLRCM